MPFGWTRRAWTGVALALLVSVGALLGLSTIAHSHEGDVPLRHCEVCRWTTSATPGLVILLVLVVTLPASGPAHVPAHVLQAQTSRRRTRSRGPPLV